MIHFVGAGSGAPDLITVRGKKYLEEADVVIYAGSLVNPQLLEYTKDICTIYNSAKMTLEEVLSVMEKAEAQGTVLKVYEPAKRASGTKINVEDPEEAVHQALAMMDEAKAL